MTRSIRLIADDYGLAPGVSSAILDLIERGRLTGTSCMTGFPEWEDAAARIRPFRQRAAVGLHLTLTDQTAATGSSSLAPDGKLPRLASLALPVRRGRIDERDVHAELDAQYDRFTEALAGPPDHIDGHQHVHFLPVVRTWLLARFEESARRPALRGAPGFPGLDAAAAKIAAIATLAAGFNRSMQRAGFRLMTPLSGIYDWRQPQKFAPMLRAAIDTLPEQGVFMCHPGRADDVLRARDPMQSVREVEFDFLASDDFGVSLKQAEARVMDGSA
ncbi:MULTISPECIES: ChbG/HpnK family deacetylase [unclassified Mesorhizobium]|uniref:ChbG/HpnK family deacetylase n=1 Tax=unclassified Mesorhizobium TaxID=325217 RepID=UPI0011289E40|nr:MULTISPECIES: ChbG/HpnK family deacetylase [unclassified Mesorhizobium]TPL04666.1 ChbG/HpnK family deacetylase [Mesorhizobium sp. B2-4-16]TPL76786.1 ChbG/HpnK family deacetylase [Mesorhizobium sp. B2-4-3]